jgi:GNAT superfamily N-acetyltransferase
MNLTLRHAGPDDVDFLNAMLAEAMVWRPGTPPPPAASVLGSRYVLGWPRVGDGGLIAVEDGSAQPVGATWYRLMSPDEPGYGFVDNQTPEVTIGVVRSRRRMGVGRRLLVALVGLARANGHAALSLSVEEDNFALGLYESVGFERLKMTGNAWTLVFHLR